MNKINEKFDIAIIGGGAAGLSAALTAGRANRSIIVFDDQRPRNAPAKMMMNFPSHDGVPPEHFRELVRNDLKKYPKIQMRNERVTILEKQTEGFQVNDVFAKKILLAHGIQDILPELPGFKELFGKAIFHCPYCHGYEHLNAAFGIIASGEMLHHYSKLVGGLSKDLIIFTNGEPAEGDSQLKIYTNKIIGLEYEGESLTGVRLDNGEVIPRSYLFMRPGLKLSTDLGLKLGCELTEMGLYKVNEMGLTTVPGVYAAGDIATPMQSVLMACSKGQFAGAAMNMEILMER